MKMESISHNEMLFVLSIFKNPENQFNSNSIAKHLGISSMGALKIARKLKKEGVLELKQLGKAKFFRLNLEKDYAKQYIKFLLKREAELAHPYIKRWTNELRKAQNATSIILFGSVLKRKEYVKDIDSLFIVDKSKFSKLKKEIQEINLINVKKVHPLYQTRDDFKKNIKKGDKVILNSIKGIVASGEDIIIELLR